MITSPVNRRRGVIALCIALLVGPSLHAHANDKPQTPRIAIVFPDLSTAGEKMVNVIRDRLGQLGWIQGKSAEFDVRSAEGNPDNLPRLFREVVSQGANVIITASTPAALAAKRATNHIPVVITGVGDPLASGIVSSLAHPEGNITGISYGAGDGLAGKWVELLIEVVPKIKRITFVQPSDNPVHEIYLKSIREATTARGLRLRVARVKNMEQIEAALKQSANWAQGVIIPPDPMTISYRKELASFAAKFRLPAIYGLHDFVRDGGLMAYGPHMIPMMMRAAEHADKILRGARPQDIPVEQFNHYVLTVNMSTAKALRLKFPESILLRSEEFSK